MTWWRGRGAAAEGVLTSDAWVVMWKRSEALVTNGDMLPPSKVCQEANAQCRPRMGGQLLCGAGVEKNETAQGGTLGSPSKGAGLSHLAVASLQILSQEVM